jgi:hypothetical protein
MTGTGSQIQFITLFSREYFAVPFTILSKTLQKCSGQKNHFAEPKPACFLLFSWSNSNLQDDTHSEQKAGAALSVKFAAACKKNLKRGI